MYVQNYDVHIVHMFMHKTGFWQTINATVYNYMYA